MSLLLQNNISPNFPRITTIFYRRIQICDYYSYLGVYLMMWSISHRSPKFESRTSLFRGMKLRWMGGGVLCSSSFYMSMSLKRQVGTAQGVWRHRVHILVKMKYVASECFWLLSWSVPYTATLYVMANLVKGVGVHPSPSQPGLIFPSWWNVHQKAAVATLCVTLINLTTSMDRAGTFQAFCS